MPELRDLIRDALNTAIENDYRDWLRDTPTDQLAIDLADKDAEIEEYVARHTDDAPAFVSTHIEPLVTEWLLENKVRPS